MLTALQLTVLHILDHAKEYPWSVQGFGVLRLFIRGVGRLHIWDTNLRYPGVSLVHNHSWSLESTIVAGELMNTRYVENVGLNPTHWKQRLLTGYKSKTVAEPTKVHLRRLTSEYYRAGDVYSQQASEIHETNALNGTITVMRRDEDENGHADVYWPLGAEWGTAIPRPATPEEVQATVQRAHPWLTLAQRRAR